MHTKSIPEQVSSQPEIKTEDIKKPKQQKKPQANLSDNDKSQSQDNSGTLKKSIEMMEQIKAKHPECIPVFYVKHQASPKEFPSPKIPFILFKKQLKIEQAMYNLYNQIEIKGLYFFCTRYDEKDKRMKYVIIKPGQTIEQIYNRYGRNGHLTLIYGDKTIGMGGINRMQKWLVRIMILLLVIWAFLYGHPMYLAYEEGGLPAVWDTLSLVWNRSKGSQSHNQKVNQTQRINRTDPASKQAQQVVFMQEDLFQENPGQQDILRQKNEWKSSQIDQNSFDEVLSLKEKEIQNGDTNLQSKGQNNVGEREEQILL